MLDPNNLVTLTLQSPIFDHTPSECPFEPVYTLNPCPAADSNSHNWITCAPTPDVNITVSTKDHTLVAAKADGTYSFTLDITDNKSDQTNSEVTFDVVLKIIPATSITVDT